ncbi:aminotransferase class I/II-fold pyridoxal phosphate-dependent enzyme [Alkalicoccus saliphilus]|uniref:Arginine decarboxylase n=1 Tax=Alkalicoccus saliphilus TaxID=200989 RepID=A0A2T4U403_9BACI|nr:aminotransferase class I/II-fold pyridoxal phosphate-dependent enzyme [Alkalicoccus saliphilus]PTL38130.1 arginine decarboxylase [Alkalicoccus saliphilus]
MNQSLTPLFTALKHKNETVSCHVPGHKNGRVFLEEASPYYRKILRLDATEIEGLDDLHEPEGVIREAEELLSALYDSDSSFFLTGGSTSGNLALLLAAGPGEKIIVQRNSHQSVFHGLELADQQPVFLAPETDSVSGLGLGVSSRQLEKALRSHPDTKAVFLTNPTYEGYTLPLKEHVEVCRAYDTLLFVDEAHGAHFLPGSSPWFPESALSAGADAVVQSAHKTLPAMTMGAWLHLGVSMDKTEVKRRLSMIQSSSPSYPIMGSLDAARAYAARKNDWKETVEVISLHKKMLETKIRLLPESIGPYRLDPLKINLYTEEEGRPEKWQEQMKRERLFPELISPVHLLVVLSLDKEDISETIKKLAPVFSRETFIEKTHYPVPGKGLTSLVYTYGEMFTKKTHEVSWEESEGMTAAETVIPYPPGIPLLLRGERIHSTHVEERNRLRKKGVRIKGGREKLKVFDPGEDNKS